MSIKDSLPKMVCTTCLKKLENIHRFAKMAAEMQEKFRMLLATKQEKPKIKIKSLDDINKEAVKECNNKSVVINDENYKENFISGWKSKLKSDLDDENIEMNLDVAVEIVGSDVNTTEVKLDDDITTENNLTDERNFNKKNEHKITRKKNKIERKREKEKGDE
mgnify:FL=1